MKKIIFFAAVIFLSKSLFSQQTITVHFLYGSKPAKGNKNAETKWFGGKKGGHVTIETGDSIVGFQPGGKCHVFGKM
jgi:hypothetical protein